MNTTSLFVELIVIGIGAACWILLLVFAVFGYEWVKVVNDYFLILAVPLLAFVYVLGIVSDRLIDKLFDVVIGKSIRNRKFPDPDEYFESKRLVLLESERMADAIEYSRSRLRICRGWAVHALLIAFVIPFFTKAQLSGAWAAKFNTFGITIFLALALVSFFGWYYLNTTQYLKIKEQAEFLRAVSRNKKSKSVVN